MKTDMHKITTLLLATLLFAPLAALNAAPQKSRPPARHPDKADAIHGDEGAADTWNPMHDSKEKGLLTPESAKRLEWFREAKYGLMISWGLFAIHAGEWKGKTFGGKPSEFVFALAKIPVKEYEQLAKQFNPVKFNADEWAQLAADSGMKYVVMIVKHSDGFSLYHSAVDKFNCVDASPWKRDPFKELQAACAKRNLKLCFYYSQSQDWHAPGGSSFSPKWDPAQNGDFEEYFRTHSIPQVKELLTNYGPIGLVWFDGLRNMTPALSKEMADMVRATQPQTLFNSRLGPGNFHDYVSPKDSQVFATVTTNMTWETVGKLNDSWGFKKNDHRWKTPEQVCFKLVDIVSKGGNFLLNVGPDAEGIIPQPSQDVLRKVGAWLKVNGEAIYGASPTVFGQEYGKLALSKDEYGRRIMSASGRDWRCTTKAGKLYIHFFQWPGEKFELGGVKNTVTKAYLLADPARKPLPVAQTDRKLVVSLPPRAPDALASVLCLENQ